MNKIKPILRNQNGFSLIEVLVAASLSTILATGMMVMFENQQKQMRLFANKTNAMELTNALRLNTSSERALRNSIAVEDTGTYCASCASYAVGSAGMVAGRDISGSSSSSSSSSSGIGASK